MPKTESLRNVTGNLDNGSVQSHNDSGRWKGRSRTKLSSWRKKLAGGEQHDHQNEHDENSHSPERMTNRTWRNTNSTQTSNDQRVVVPARLESTVRGDQVLTGHSRTPIADSQIARSESTAGIGGSGAVIQIEQEKLLARDVVLQSQAEKYQAERDAANLECIKLQEEVSRLRTERDKSRDLHTMYAKLDIEAGQLQNDRNILHNDKTKLQTEFDHLQAENDKLVKEYRQLEGDMEKKAKDSRQARKVLEDDKERWQRHSEIVSGLNGQVETLETRFREQEVVLALVRKERNALKPLAANFDKLKDQHKANLEQFDRCKAELIDCQQNYDDLQNRHATASDDLKRLTLESRSTLGDDFFIRNFQGLQGAIRQWANNHFRGEEKNMWSSQYPQKHPVIHADLLEMTADAKDLLMFSDTGSGRAVMCEAYIWRYIEEQVFDSNPSEFCKGMYWAHDVRAEVCRLERFLRPGKRWPDAEQRMFYKWRASTSKLIINRLHPSNDRSRIAVDPKIHAWLVDHALDVLRPWMTSDNERACIEDLEAIIQSAIDFDSHMNEQWSFMYVATKPSGFTSRYGFPFESEMMEPIRNDMQIFVGDAVGVVVSPALVRMGTAKADNYDLQSILVRSKVIPQGFSARSQRDKNGKTSGLVTRSLQRW